LRRKARSESEANSQPSVNVAAFERRPRIDRPATVRRSGWTKQRIPPRLEPPAFLRYLERRVDDHALAEDILQDTFTKVVARPEQAPDDQAIVPWFYRTLRNAAIDQFRRRGAAGRALEAFARELDTQETPSTELEAEICACVSRLAATLKPELRGGSPGDRGRRDACEDLRRTERSVFEQRGSADLSREGSLEEARHGIMWHVC
jgi:hypothetical protein